MCSSDLFDAVLARQGRAVTAAKTVTEGLVRAIAQEVAEQRPTASGYGPSAQGAAYRQNGTAITLNQRA